jgi:hypothetical protein
MYNIVRHYADPRKSKRVIARGVTLAEAQAHCKDPESASKSCTLASRKAITRRNGEWFDGYVRA